MKFEKILLRGLLFSAFSLGALQSHAQVQIGVRAGFNLSNMTAKKEDGSKVYGNDLKFHPGFHVGATIDIPVADEFYVQPAALFSTKGSKYSTSDDLGTFEGTTTPYYLEVPVNLLYKPELGAGHLLLGVGPFGAYGLGGKWKTRSTSGTADNPIITNKKGPMEFVNDLGDASGGDKLVYGKVFDYGANLLIGYVFSNRLSAQLNAQLGLANIEPKPDEEQSTGVKRRNVGLGISVGCVL